MISRWSGVALPPDCFTSMKCARPSGPTTTTSEIPASRPVQRRFAPPRRQIHASADGGGRGAGSRHDLGPHQDPCRSETTRKKAGRRVRQDGSAVIIDPATSAMGRAVAAARSRARAAELQPTIARLQAEGITSLGALARALTEHGIPTARCKGTWAPAQVARILSGQDV
jgi:hypothetical protein